MNPPVPTITSITLRWLLRLRWAAVAGQLAALLFVALKLKVELPWPSLIAALGFAAMSNLLLRGRSEIKNPHQEWLLAAVIGADVVVLSILLYFTGGASNPFSSFYLVLVALGAMVLSVRWLAALVGLAIACYMVVFHFGQPLVGPDGIGEIGCPGFGLHLKGMAVAFLLTALCIAYFVQKMHRNLQFREAELAEAKALAAKADQFSSLAALAAGVAHELGSPLGTIAVAAHELERSLSNSDSEATLHWRQDAQLIRQEVERCRCILDRLDRRSTSGTGHASRLIEIRELLEQGIDPLSEENQDRIEVGNDIPTEAVLVPHQPLVQSITILLQNACDADVRKGRVRLSAAIKDGFLEITVADQGPGFEEIALKHAGEPFFTTKAPRKGMGLGLFFVRTLAQQLGGELSHLNRPEGGAMAILRISLPNLSHEPTAL